MELKWYGFPPPALPAGTVVVEATEQAAPFWAPHGPVCEILDHLQTSLPASARPGVALLGDRSARPLPAVLGALQSEAPAPGAPDLARQLGRAPVAGPFLREWSRGPALPVVFAAVSPVLDLEDWSAPEAVRAVLVYRLLGAERVTPPPFREIGPEAGLDDVVAHLRDPLTEVRVGGRAFAVDWAGAEFRWDGGALRATGEECLAGAVLLAHAEGERPRAELHRASGAVVKHTLVPCEPPPARAPRPVSPEAASVLRVWGGGRDFFCSACGAAHPPGRVWCEGEPPGAVIPSLAAPGTVWRLRQQNGWSATPYPHGVFALADGRIVAGRAGRWDAFEFRDNAWVPVDPPEGLIALDDEVLLLAT